MFQCQATAPRIWMKKPKTQSERNSSQDQISKPNSNDHSRLLSCSTCGREFRRRSDLERHEGSKHSEKTDFFCAASGCKRTAGFKRKDNCLQHVRTVHKESAGGDPNKGEAMKLTSDRDLGRFEPALRRKRRQDHDMDVMSRAELAEEVREEREAIQRLEFELESQRQRRESKIDRLLQLLERLDTDSRE